MALSVVVFFNLLYFIIFLCFICSSAGGHLGRFHFLAVGTHVRASRGHLFSVLWGVTPRRGIAGSYGNSVSHLSNRQTAAQSGCRFAPPVASERGPRLSASSPAAGLVVSWSQPTIVERGLVGVGRVTVLRCAFLVTADLERLFRVQMSHLFIFFGETSIQINPLPVF